MSGVGIVTLMVAVTAMSTARAAVQLQHTVGQTKHQGRIRVQPRDLGRQRRVGQA
jgi:hypothetical protein